MNRLDKNIAYNLRRIRKLKNMSLDMLSERTGVSKSMLGQIERGESNPTVITISKIVEGLRISFEELLYLNEQPVTVFQETEYPIYKEEKNSYQIRIVFPYDRQRNFEVHSILLYPGASYGCDSQGEDMCGYVTVNKGKLTLKVEETTVIIKEKDSVRFLANREFSYKNNTDELVEANIVMAKEKK